VCRPRRPEHLIEALRAAAVPPCTQANPASQSKARRCVAATVHVHARPHRARSAQHPGNHGAARSVAATHTSVPAQETLARRPVPNVLIARLRRRPRARTAQELPSSRYGSHAARRPATRQETTTTRLDVAKHHRKETKGEKREEGPRCPRWGDGVAVAGLSVAWRRCSGREGVPAR
jgi:hypothetical protein